MPRRTPHPLCLALGGYKDERHAPCPDLCRSALDDKPIINRRLTLNQDQAVGNDRFYREIEAKTFQRRELRKRGRPGSRMNSQQPTTRVEAIRHFKSLSIN